jgi:REP element-mobilizing transposase RayT
MAIDPKLYRPHSLPRLHPSSYQADALVLWTHTTFDRAKLPLTDEFHFQIRELILHTCVRESLLCPTYVLMPDHIHLIFLGTKPVSDQLNATRFFRTHLTHTIKPIRLQPQPHDHVFTEKERTRNAFASACNYILQNPTRAKLMSNGEAWPYTGALLPGYPDLNPFSAAYWPTFWKIFQKLRDPACDQHTIRRAIQNNSP